MNTFAGTHWLFAIAALSLSTLASAGGWDMEGRARYDYPTLAVLYSAQNLTKRIVPDNQGLCGATQLNAIKEELASDVAVTVAKDIAKEDQVQLTHEQKKCLDRAIEEMKSTLETVKKAFK